MAISFVAAAPGDTSITSLPASNGINLGVTSVWCAMSVEILAAQGGNALFWAFL